MIDTSLINIESINDSIYKVIPIVKAIEEHTAPVPFTYINIVISALAALFGLIGAFYGWRGYLFSKKTAKNVSRLTPKTQEVLCRDLLVDLLQNVIRFIFVIKRLKKDKERPFNPDSLSLLQLWPADVYFQQEAYNEKPELYKLVYNLKKRMLSFNDDLLKIKIQLEKNSNFDPRHLENLLKSNIKNINKALIIHQKAYETLYSKHRNYLKLNLSKPMGDDVETDNIKLIIELYVNENIKYLKNLLDNKTDMEVNASLYSTYVNIYEKLNLNDSWDNLFNDKKDDMVKMIINPFILEDKKGKISPQLKDYVMVVFNNIFNKDKWTYDDTKQVLLEIICVDATLLEQQINIKENK